MTIFPACEIKDKGGKLGINISSKYGPELQEALSKFKNGFVQVILKKPGSAKSQKQRETFHLLLGLYFKSGLHSSKNYDGLKADLKIRYGWVVFYDHDGEKYQIIVSTEKYTMEKYSKLIDGTIAEMEQSGILTSGKYGLEYETIRKGMESNNKRNL